jgi:8-oxo-dGTP pyrophosphatase MutT (NUDIX family)
MIREWEVISREVVNDFGIVQIHKKQARSPRTGDVRDILAIDFPDWVLVLAITPEKEVVMVRQYRHGIERICLELPGGLVDPGDASPAVAAKRELLEETGYQSVEFVPIGECYPQPAVLSNRCFFFLAKNAQKVQEPELDAGEDLEILTTPLKEISSKITNKHINHGMVCLAFQFYWMQNEIKRNII